MTPLNPIKLSKTISHALRHEPYTYNLTLDQEGWVEISLLIDALRTKGWHGLQPEDIISIVESSEKKRFQILQGRIKVYYGHSTGEKITKQQQIPPDILYHGTTAERQTPL